MQTKPPSLLPALVVVFLWLAASILIANQGLFLNSPEAPPYVLMVSVVVPPILFGIAYTTIGGFRTYVLGLDLTFLTAIQGWRVIGGMFLVLMTYRIVPGTFAWPAGVGDLIVGFYAPFVVLALVRKSPNWRMHVIVLNILGLLDFIGAVGTGVLTGNNPLGILREDVTTEVFQRLPISIIPTFAVPAWIVIHIISLLQVSRTNIRDIHSSSARGEQKVA